MPNKAEGKKQNLVVFAGIALLIAGGGAWLLKLNTSDNQVATQETVLNQTVPAPTEKKGVLKNFTGAQFRDLYNNFAYPNTKRINEDTPITGNGEADAHIRKLALARGYMIRSAPVTDVFKTVETDMRLQERSAQPWIDMVEAAKKDNVRLELTAAYRSAETQKEILLSKLKLDGIAISRIASGVYDTELDSVLSSTAVPGFSRHHTGYTIDIGCIDQPYVVFEATKCFEWLSKDNYKNSKTFGWIPSYPEGAGKQGPDPETWEYVWVGVDALTE